MTIHTYIRVSLIPPREDQCEWHRMTRMTGPDCVVMCNLINTYDRSSLGCYYESFPYVPPTVVLYRKAKKFACLSANLNASRPPSTHHPSVRGGNVKTFGSRWDHIGCKDNTYSWHLIGFPDGSDIGSTASCRGDTHRYSVPGTLLSYINRHARTPKTNVAEGG